VFPLSLLLVSFSFFVVLRACFIDMLSLGRYGGSKVCGGKRDKNHNLVMRIFILNLVMD
jgi:hypothetical protein